MCLNGPDWWQWLVWGGAIWALSAAPWRKASLALVLAWAIAEAWAVVTCDSLPTELYVRLDVPVIAAIVLWRNTRLDLVIWAIFPAAWCIYVWEWSGRLHPYYAWWLLYWLALAQFILAGPWPKLLEIARERRRRRRRRQHS